MAAVPGSARLKREFAARLRAVRLRAGMSQGDLAQKAGVNKSTVSALECGLADPRLRTVVLLAGALGTCPATLVLTVLDAANRRAADAER